MCCIRPDLDTVTDQANVRAVRPTTAPARLQRPSRSLAAIVAGSAAAVAIAAAALVAGASTPRHDLTLVARDMAFYLPDGAVPNPPIEVTAEEAVRLTLVNRDAGIDHDLAVASLGVESPVVPGDGSTTTIEFRAPREPGEHEYVCRLHGRMMRGTLIVR
jgi:plastocyanin